MFLRAHLGAAERIHALTAGEHSTAFGFRSEGRELVLRVGHSAAGYRKDRFAHQHLASGALPIPRVLEIGAYDSDRSFALSERAAGQPLALRPREEIPEWLDAIFGVLRSLHRAPAPGSGFGAWDGATGDAHCESFREALLAWAEPNEVEAEDRAEEFEPELVERLRERFRSLVPACPELRHVVHADVSGHNLIGERYRITALLDFGLAMYGEPAYDLAQLVYGLPHLDLMPRIHAHLEALGIGTYLLEERLLCYQLAVCLQSLRWSIATGQRERYRESCERAEELMTAPAK